MAEQSQMTDPELERELTELGSHLAYPATPQLARAVRTRLVARPARRPFWETLQPMQRRLAFAAAVLIVLVASVLLIPDARTAVARFFGLQGIVITSEPSPLPSPLPTLPPGPLGERLSLGQRVTLADAQGRVRFHILVPTLPDLGDPDEVYFAQPPASGAVALVYQAKAGLRPAAQTGVGLLVTEFRGDIDPGSFGKSLGPGTRLGEVRVRGVTGYWIEGQPHFFFYRDGGEFRNETLRLAANTLIWEQDGVTVRIESVLTKDEVLRIAESMR